MRGFGARIGVIAIHQAAIRGFTDMCAAGWSHRARRGNSRGCFPRRLAKMGRGAGADIAWLLTVARNLIGNAYRSRDRRIALQAKLRATAELPFR